MIIDLVRLGIIKVGPDRESLYDNIVIDILNSVNDENIVKILDAMKRQDNSISRRMKRIQDVISKPLYNLAWVLNHHQKDAGDLFGALRYKATDFAVTHSDHFQQQAISLGEQSLLHMQDNARLRKQEAQHRAFAILLREALAFLFSVQHQQPINNKSQLSLPQGFSSISSIRKQLAQFLSESNIIDDDSQEEFIHWFVNKFLSTLVPSEK